ncbi:MAG: gamma-glutamyltransferase [Rhodospirillales bacterium]
MHGNSLLRRLAALAAAALLAGCAAATPTGTASVPAPAPAATAQRHMVAAANPLAAAAGLEMLRAGGSAVDAAVAVQMVLGLVEPQSSGIGGGAFLMHFQADALRVEMYDGRETAPAAAHAPVLGAAGASGRAPTLPELFALRRGGHTVGVPGAVRMLALAHREHGRLPWARLFAPAIRLAQDGFAVSPRLADAIARTRDALKDDPAAATYFLNPDGSPKAAGARLANPALAATLAAIAADPEALYRGPIADGIVRAVGGTAVNPGRMTAEDLARYRPVKREPVCGPYRVWRLCGAAPPSAGGIAVLQILTVLERFDMATLAPGGAAAVHLLAEAGRLAYADRDRYVADPDFADVPVRGLIDRGYLAARGAAIDPARSMGKAAPGRPPGATAAARADDSASEIPATSHLSIVDGAGNAVAMTTTVEATFGARIMTGGFLLNNELTDFAWMPGERAGAPANRVEGGKRPRSSMSPTLVFDRAGRLVMTVGSPGGSAIIGYVAKTLVAALDGNLSAQAAIDLPNTVNRNGDTELEDGAAPAGLAEALRARGHAVRLSPLVSGVHAIRVTPAGLEGGADRRREGVAVGD